MYYRGRENLKPRPQTRMILFSHKDSFERFAGRACTTPSLINKSPPRGKQADQNSITISVSSQQHRTICKTLFSLFKTSPPPSEKFVFQNLQMNTKREVLEEDPYSRLSTITNSSFPTILEKGNEENTTQ